LNLKRDLTLVLGDFAADRAWARGWLFDAALPLWREQGADYVRGGWWDKLDQHGKPLNLPKRLRVQARQAFVFAEAGRLGWTGPWREAVSHGIDYILGAFRREDGFFRGAVTPDGLPLVEAADLYDQAFVLFSLASAYSTLGRPKELLVEAVDLLQRLETKLGHPGGGFEEAHPPVLPLRSNPHMHLLEAMLAWIEAGERHVFERHARQIISLAFERLIDPKTGGIGEYYDRNWLSHPESGHIREPGHQFEWAYLLHKAGRLLGVSHGSICQRLYEFGAGYGIRDGRAVFSIDADGALIDGSSRLWAQTERLRTLLILGSEMLCADRNEAFAGANDAIITLRRMLDTPIFGLWFDKLDSSGNVIDEPAPASSLYHIVTGIVPLISSNEVADISIESQSGAIHTWNA
jgi:mannose/cellobiose epimerase-like protein (N-acyl-D-glucosamine 2-epimerase family)